MKISFIGNFKDVQSFNNKATVVTLTGRFKMPDWWHRIPHDVYEWIDTHPSVNVNESFGTAEVILVVQGKAVCAEEDEFNAALGEWIAESRAKIKLYKFMYTLCKKLLAYYFTAMYGNREVDLVRESHTEPPRSCIWSYLNKYRELVIKESHHLGKLLEEV